ncbi:hypothetical protein D1AOALGA4SA_5519 [Olavius algarvensis Delta 1 endosymbiont]|nr:hypothetical protein D1AOALGA4SA_5519 [Olavius algarvensis Delta 1 endosymbiont]
MQNEFVIQPAKDEDLNRLITFLSQPEIDKGFCKPLSDRNISIRERVYLKYKRGLWILAEIEDQIVSCVAIVPEGMGVSFSTFACKDNKICKFAGGRIWEESLKLARDFFNASFIEIDSWEGNEFISRFLAKRGFKKIGTYCDPDKRPDCVNSVLYRMTLNQQPSTELVVREMVGVTHCCKPMI